MTNPNFGPPRKDSSSSCVVVGLIGCGVIFLMVLVIAVVGYFGIKGFVTGMLEQYTSTDPVELPASQMDETEYAALEERVNAFKQGLDDGSIDTPLVLTGEDINALIAYHPDWKDVKGKAHVTIEDDTIGAQVSIPLDALVKGRYLNGSGTFRVFSKGGALFVLLDSLEVNGQSVPDQFMQQVRKENLAAEVQNDPNFRRMLESIDSIDVEGGELIITPSGAGTI